MRAIVVERQGNPVTPNVAFRTDWPEPSAPGAGQVRVRALARRCAESYVADREAMGHPLIKQPARAGKGASTHSLVTTK